MSWSVKVIGTKAGLQRVLPALFEKAAKPFEGGREGEDILAVRDRVVAAIDAAPDVREAALQQMLPPGVVFGFLVDASGYQSGSSYTKGTFEVTSAMVVVDPGNPATATG
jgi:hypothetical protein